MSQVLPTNQLLAIWDLLPILHYIVQPGSAIHSDLWALDCHIPLRGIQCARVNYNVPNFHFKLPHGLRN
jgi:hypothetical protein